MTKYILTLNENDGPKLVPVPDELADATAQGVGGTVYDSEAEALDAAFPPEPSETADGPSEGQPGDDEAHSQDGKGGTPQATENGPGVKPSDVATGKVSV